MDHRATFRFFGTESVAAPADLLEEVAPDGGSAEQSEKCSLHAEPDRQRRACCLDFAADARHLLFKCLVCLTNCHVHVLLNRCYYYGSRLDVIDISVLRINNIARPLLRGYLDNESLARTTSQVADEAL